MNVLTCFQVWGAEFIICRERLSLGMGGVFISTLEKIMAMLVEVELRLLWRKNSIYWSFRNKLI